MIRVAILSAMLGLSAVGVGALAGDVQPKVPALQKQLDAANARVAQLTALNAAVAKGIQRCQVQRNAALDQAINDEMNRP